MGRLARARAWCRGRQVLTHVVAHLVAGTLVLGSAWLVGSGPFDDDDHKDEDLPTLEEVAERCIRNSDSCAEPIETKGGILYIHEK